AKRAEMTNLLSNGDAPAALVTSTPHSISLERRIFIVVCGTERSDARCVYSSQTATRTMSASRIRRRSTVGDENGNTQCRLTWRIKGESCRDGSEGCGQDRREPRRGRQRT